MSQVADVRPLRSARESSGALPVSMIERMTLVLEVFDGPGRQLILEDVAQLTGLPRSTTHRILDQLVRLDWLRHGHAGYALGARALALGGGERVDADLRFAAAPLLQELALRTGLVVHLAVLDGGSVRYLDKVGGRRAVQVPSRVGGTQPAYATALGKAMLAWLDPEEVDARLGDAIAPRTADTVKDLGTLHHELHRIRGRGGLAIERAECFPGIGCVAAAIRGPERPLGAISLVGEPDTQLERVAPLVVQAARTVSIELFEGLQTC